MRGLGSLALMLATVALGCEGSRGAAQPTPQGVMRDCGRDVFLARTVAAASVVGDWNGWRPGADPMRAIEGGAMHARVTPPPGWHRYRIWADGETALDASAPLSLYGEDGEEHSAFETPDCAAPALTVQALHASELGEVSVEARLERARSGAALDPASVRAMLEDGRALAVTIEGDRVRAVAAGVPVGKHRVTLEAADRDGVKAAPARPVAWVEAAPFDWRGALIYQVVVDRFRPEQPGNPALGRFHGGNLDGVRAALEEGYFEALGVSALWLSPLAEQPPGPYTSAHDGRALDGYHGYWPVAPRAVDPRFGGEEALDRLVVAAHARGIRVLGDLVLNHVHVEHPYARAHAMEWFRHPAGDCICGLTCSWGADAEECWFDSFLPDLDWRRADVAFAMTADAVWWLERFELDGFRLDAVPMMPRLATRHLRDRAGGVHLVGETYVGRGHQQAIRYSLGPQGLSGQFDFPTMWALREVLGPKGVGFAELEAELAAGEAAWAGSGAIMSPLIGNHDTSRLLSLVAGHDVDHPWDAPAPDVTAEEAFDRHALGLVFLLTQPGAPALYYGDEVAMAGAEDPDSRRDLPAEAALGARQRETLALARTLGKARACSRALRLGDRRPLVVEADRYAYARESAEGRPAIVVLNRGEAADLTIELPADLDVAVGAGFTDLLGGTPTLVDRTLTVRLPARGAAVLLSESDCTH
jgi:glycosidase